MLAPPLPLELSRFSAHRRAVGAYQVAQCARIAALRTSVKKLKVELYSIWPEICGRGQPFLALNPPLFTPSSF